MNIFLMKYDYFLPFSGAVHYSFWNSHANIPCDASEE